MNDLMGPTLRAMARLASTDAAGATNSVERTSAPTVPVFAIVLTLLLFAGALLDHWQFRTGWRMTAGRLGEDPALRDFKIALGYSALPSAIALGSMTAMFTVMRMTDGSLNTFGADAVLLLGAVFLLSSGWAFKEYFRPSRRRTPPWLE